MQYVVSASAISYLRLWLLLLPDATVVSYYTSTVFFEVLGSQFVASVSVKTSCMWLVSSGFFVVIECCIYLRNLPPGEGSLSQDTVLTPLKLFQSEMNLCWFSFQDCLLSYMNEGRNEGKLNNYSYLKKIQQSWQWLYSHRFPAFVRKLLIIVCLISSEFIVITDKHSVNSLSTDCMQYCNVFGKVKDCCRKFQSVISRMKKTIN